MILCFLVTSVWFPFSSVTFTVSIIISEADSGIYNSTPKLEYVINELKVRKYNKISKK